MMLPRSRLRGHASAPIALLATLFLVAWTGCYHGASRTISAGVDPNHWQQVSPPSTGYRVSMPAAPRIETEEMTDFDGTRMVATTGRYEQYDRAVYGFAILYAENGHAPDPTESVSRARRGGRNDDEVVRSRHSYVDQGFPTVDMVIEDRTNGIVFFTRLSVGRNRVFYSFVGVRAAKEAQMKSTVDYFLGSIHLHPSEAMSPVGDGHLNVRSWQYVYPPEGDFAALMPGAPRRVETEIPGDEDPIEVLAYGVQSDDHQHVFDVRVVDYGHRPTEEEVAAARARLTGGGYTLREERAIERQGYAGRELKLDSPSSFVKAHLYFTANRLYVVQVRVPKSYEVSSEPAQRRFFDSFRIL